MVEQYKMVIENGRTLPETIDWEIGWLNRKLDERVIKRNKRNLGALAMYERAREHLPHEGNETFFLVWLGKERLYLKGEAGERTKGQRDAIRDLMRLIERAHLRSEA